MGEVLSELPDKRRQKIPVEIPNNKALKDIRNEMHQLGDNFEVGEKGPGIFMELSKAKLEPVKEYILDVTDRCDDKFIIFAHHQHVLDYLEAALSKRLAGDGHRYIRIDGKTNAAKRVDLVKAFQTDPACRVALLSITACSEGLTLTAASLVIFAELYWVPGVIEQAEARAHRIGTTHSKVVVEYLVARGSPDEVIYKRLERKMKDTSRVLDGTAKSLGAQERIHQVKRKKQSLDPVAPATAAATPSKAKAARLEPSPTAAVASAATPSKVERSDAINSEVNTAAVVASAATPSKAERSDAINSEVNTAAAVASAATPSKAARSDEKVTPSPLDRSKVEYLLRAVRQG